MMFNDTSQQLFFVVVTAGLVATFPHVVDATLAKSQQALVGYSRLVVSLIFP